MRARLPSCSSSSCVEPRVDRSRTSTYAAIQRGRQRSQGGTRTGVRKAVGIPSFHREYLRLNLRASQEQAEPCQPACRSHLSDQANARSASSLTTHPACFSCHPVQIANPSCESQLVHRVRCSRPTASLRGMSVAMKAPRPLPRCTFGAAVSHTETYIGGYC